MDLLQEVDAGSRDELVDKFRIPDVADPEGRTDLANARRFVARYGSSDKPTRRDEAGFDERRSPRDATGKSGLGSV